MIKNGGTMLNSSMGSAMFRSKPINGSPASKKRRAPKNDQPRGGDQEETFPEQEENGH
jgi:hypothetical protein